MANLCRVPDELMMGDVLMREKRIEQLNLHALTIIQEFCFDPMVAQIEFGLDDAVRQRLGELSRDELIAVGQAGHSLVHVRSCLASAINVQSVDWAGRGLLRGLGESRRPFPGRGKG